MTSKYTKSAKGQSCTARIPGVCNYDPDTVVLAHINGYGMGGKHLDIHGCYACSDCHRWLDGEYVKTSDKLHRNLFHLEAMLKTQAIMVKDGVLEL